MAHLTLEYSANLKVEGDFNQLCLKLAQSIVAQGGAQPVFPIGGIRVRAIPCDDFCIGDGRFSDAAFVHGIFKVGAGRSERVKQKALEDAFEVMKTHFSTQFETQGLALSLELLEFSEAGALKHNNLHQRFLKK